MTDENFTLPAYAKINLSLRVLGRRPDGYHEIQTVFQTVTLSDKLTFSPVAHGGIDFTCSSPWIPTSENNLVVRAASALRQRFAIEMGARIELEKSIAVGGGLGGGSADAAITLIGLARLWRIDVTWRELAQLGGEIGADIPFFFTGGRAFGSGTGNSILALDDLPFTHLIVVSPDVEVSSGQAYKALNAPALTKDKAVAMLPISRTEPVFSGSVCSGLLNDFETVIFRLYPEIERAKSALLAAGARCAVLSGSGSSVYGIFDSDVHVGRALESLNATREWRVFPCSTLSRTAYREALGECAAFLRPSK